VWWDALARQYKSERVEFRLEGTRPGARVPRSLFDSVADNLLRNALAKRSAQPGLRIAVSLTIDAAVALRVKDSGAAIPEDITRRLLRGPVDSPGGLGIGLYQAARQAEAAGYTLTLEGNRDGEVCFMLAGSGGLRQQTRREQA
jgi:signal transduction histidine kinase